MKYVYGFLPDPASQAIMLLLLSHNMVIIITVFVVNRCQLCMTWLVIKLLSRENIYIYVHIYIALYEVIIYTCIL